MPYPIWLQVVGLSLDIAGVFLIFYFGIPPRVDPEGHTYFIMEQPDELEKQKANRYRKRSNLGLYLLVGGFALQILGTVLLGITQP